MLRYTTITKVRVFYCELVLVTDSCSFCIFKYWLLCTFFSLFKYWTQLNFHGKKQYNDIKLTYSYPFPIPEPSLFVFNYSNVVQQFFPIKTNKVISLFKIYNNGILLGLSLNKDDNVHRFGLSSIRGELLEREREGKRGKRERGKERERKR